jgi:signal transduction histidine kinase
MVSQHEKLAALDKFAASLAHELNNPASAGRRAASQMRVAMTQLDQLILSFGEHLNTVQLSSLIPPQPTTAFSSPHSLLGQSDKEEEFVDWLEAHGLDDGWQFAPMLVYAGIDIASLETLALTLNGPTLQQALTWMTTIQTMHRSLTMMEQITQRISELVRAVKEYAYMDQASQKEINIHEGLESTLTILSYKLKRIVVVREYEHQLPHIMAYEGELNQAWTNLIDNAIDALNECGELRVHTMREGEYVLVEIADTGNGIPHEIQARIFEPFFTTKDVGAGLGLGLDIVYRIIVDRHHGDVRVSSKPGDTRFQIRLPIAANY